MFHWICPECGREIPPAVKECPACDPSSVEASSVLAGPSKVEAGVGGDEAAPVPAAVSEPATAPAPVSEPTTTPVGVSEPAASGPAAPPEPPSLPEPLLRLARQLREAGIGASPALEPALAAPKPVPAAPKSQHPSSPPEHIAPPAQPQMLLLQSASAAIALLAPPELQPEPQIEPQPEPEPEPLPALGLLHPPDREDLDQPAPFEAPLSDAPLECAPSTHAPLEEKIQEPDPATAGRMPTPDLAPPHSPPAAPTPRSAELAALALSPDQPAPAAPPEMFSHPALIAATLPASPALGLASLQDPSNIARRIRPASPAIHILRRDTGPRITLPGPALPAVLNSLQGAGLSKILVDRPRAPRKRAPGWLVTSLVAAVLLSGLLGLTLFNAPRTAADPSPAPSPVLTAALDSKNDSKAAPLPPVSGSISPAISNAASYSLTKAIEVTGFRFVGDKKPEMRYLVVNHSGADLEAVTVYVTLRSSTAKPGQPPLFRFSFRAPTLAAFESKEMSAPVDKPARSAGDWQNLHADIELGQ
jgi:hypothetical protein